MRALVVERQRPKPLGWLVWKVFVITAVLFSTFPNYEQSLTPKSWDASPLNEFSRRHSKPNSGDTNLSSDDTTSTERSVTPGIVTDFVRPPSELLFKGYDVPKQFKNISEFWSLTSCHGRCGDRRNFPCSCTDLCVINGNCCRDISKYCLSYVNSARKRFSHQKNVQVECSIITSTFMILSCPSYPDSGESNSGAEHALSKDAVPQSLCDSDNSRNFQENSTGTTSPSSQGLDHKNFSHLNLDSSFDNTTFPVSEREASSSPGNTFLSAVLDSPVTDKTTGLVYRNQRVARCNGVPEANTLYWKMQIAVTSVNKVPRSVSVIDDMVSLENVAYEFPDSDEDLIGLSQCMHIPERQCQKVWLQERPYLEEMCLNGSITYYKTFSPLEHQVYANIFCLMCDSGSVNFSEPVYQYAPLERTFKLSLVASLTSGGALSLKAASGKQYFTWSSVDCSLSEREQGSGACEGKGCGQGLAERPDGKCRAPHIFALSISAKDCTYAKSEQTKRKLLSLSKCYLETYLNAEFNEETTQMDYVYGKHLEFPLLQISATVYFPFIRSIAIPKIPIVLPIYRELLMLVYDADLCCDQYSPKPLCINSSCYLEHSEIPVVGTQLLSLPPLHQASGEAISNSSIILCLRSIVDNEEVKETPVSHVCLHEPVYASKLHFFRRIANVSCFGKNIGHQALHVQHRRHCNSNTSWRRAASLSVVLSALAMVFLM
ncbi:hypothetical protein ElyMa_004404800 [Elysia marginata]|uniref:SMB domain-containing protein n=1 Tax=Elysia marginata TaxID=1093978 RepID=A0AAV4H9U2_9GAST|nr:hypothetical protein ElyMa_004404800 [Elysia marginata]